MAAGSSALMGSASIADVLTEQVPGAVLEWVKITDKPEALTSGRRVVGNENQIILVRTGVSVPFALSVKGPDSRREVLWGVFTWAASGLDGSTQRKDGVWFDLHVGLEWAKQHLTQRVYEVDEA